MTRFLLPLPDGDKFTAKNIEFLFEKFKEDFIDNTVYLASMPICIKKEITCCCPFGKEDKPERFWHIITKKEDDKKKCNNPCPEAKEKNRAFCTARAKRIHRIKYLIENLQTDESINYYYQSKKRDSKLIIWHTKWSFLVIIKKIDSKPEKFLVTSFIVHQNKINRYQKEFRRYERQKPTGEEWF